VTPCSLIEVYRRFRGTLLSACWAYSLTLRWTKYVPQKRCQIYEYTILHGVTYQKIVLFILLCCAISVPHNGHYERLPTFRRISWGYFLVLLFEPTLELVRSSETSANFYHATRHHIPGESALHTCMLPHLLSKPCELWDTLVNWSVRSWLPLGMWHRVILYMFADISEERAAYIITV
jgi:hypothetical protein